MSAKPKRKPRKVVVWAVVEPDGRRVASELAEWRARYLVRNNYHIYSGCRVVRCEGVLR